MRKNYRFRFICVLRYIGLHGFGVCQTMAVDFEIHSIHLRKTTLMVSSVLSTVCLQSAEGISFRTTLFLQCCAPSASAGSVFFLIFIEHGYIQW